MNNRKHEVLATGRTAEMLAWEDGRVLKLFFDWFPEDAVRYEAKLARAIHAILAGAEACVAPDDQELAGFVGRFRETYEGYYFALNPWDGAEYELWKLVIAAARLNEGIDDLQEWLLAQVEAGLK